MFGHSAFSGGSRSVVLGPLLSLVGIIVLLFVELIATMLVYIGLNRYAFEWFGFFVRIADNVLGLIKVAIERLLPGAANTVYGTLVGELGPKAILLLLIGLVVAAILRWAIGLVFHR